ncbi:hypothetical protein Q9L58_010019 [Maublancomyces gigas]|uniref:Uncharacterized protein n=1 Tax=Discina gigas TaxID=1032678 RepID=A0ABR3G5A2_9PEZI
MSPSLSQYLNITFLVATMLRFLFRHLTPTSCVSLALTAHSLTGPVLYTMLRTPFQLLPSSFLDAGKKLSPIAKPRSPGTPSKQHYVSPHVSKKQLGRASLLGTRTGANPGSFYLNLVSSEFQPAVAGRGHVPSSTAVLRSIDPLGDTLFPCLNNQHHGTAHLHQHWQFDTHALLLHSRQIGFPKPMPIGATGLDHLVLSCTIYDSPTTIPSHAVIDAGTTRCFMTIPSLSSSAFLWTS